MSKKISVYLFTELAYTRSTIKNQVGVKDNPNTIVMQAVANDPEKPPTYVAT